jgi:hypothetical protein
MHRYHYYYIKFILFINESSACYTNKSTAWNRFLWSHERVQIDT